MEEPNNCPKDGLPESTHRYSAGKRLSICGNGHSWDREAIEAQRTKAREAEAREIKIYDRALLPEEIEKRFIERRYRGGIIDP